MEEAREKRPSDGERLLVVSVWLRCAGHLNEYSPAHARLSADPYCNALQ